MTRLKCLHAVLAACVVTAVGLAGAAHAQQKFVSVTASER